MLCNWWEKPVFPFSRRRINYKKWIYFVNSKNWTPTKYSFVCYDHFHDTFIKYGKSQCKLNWELHPRPTIQPCVNNQPSLLNTPKVPRRSPRKRALLEPSKLEVFRNWDKVKDFTSFTSEHTSFCYDFKRFDGRIQHYNLCFETESGAHAVHKCIAIETSLYVSLSYDGHFIPLPDWFCHGQNFTATRFSILKNFASYIKQKGQECSVILKKT